MSPIESGPDREMTLELEALRQMIATELVGAGVRIPPDEMARVSAAILTEAVRSSVEWVEAETAF